MMSTFLQINFTHFDYSTYFLEYFFLEIQVINVTYINNESPIVCFIFRIEIFIRIQSINPV